MATTKIPAGVKLSLETLTDGSLVISVDTKEKLEWKTKSRSHKKHSVDSTRRRKRMNELTKRKNELTKRKNELTKGKNELTKLGKTRGTDELNKRIISAMSLTSKRVLNDLVDPFPLLWVEFLVSEKDELIPVIYPPKALKKLWDSFFNFIGELKDIYKDTDI